METEEKEKKNTEGEDECPPLEEGVLQVGGTSYLKFPSKFKNIVKRDLGIKTRNLKLFHVEMVDKEKTISLIYTFDKEDMETEQIFRKDKTREI